MSDLAIKLENIKKKYKLGSIGGGTLTSDIQSWWAKFRGKEDPNVKIGVDQSKAGETFYALNGINLEVKKGEALGIIGANGAGKSTLLKLLSRVTAPTEGRIGINGRITSMLEVGTGFHPELTGRENIYMNGAILGMTKKEIDAKIEDIINFSECRKFIDTPVKRYSSGMYVKLGFAVASHLEAEIMIMDEVLAVGDMQFQNKCLTKMKDAVDNDRKTTLYVSHNMNTIQKLCTRCIVLKKGEKIFDGEVDEAIRYYFDFTNDGKSFLDLTDAPRFDNNTQNVQMRSIEFIGKDNISFFMNEKIHCRLKVDYIRRVGKLSMKFILRYIDNTIAGLYFMRDIKPLAPGETDEIKFDLDISKLAPGNYDFRIVLFELLENGQEQGHDTLQYCGKINIIQGKDSLLDLRWVHGTYGHVFLGEIERKNEKIFTYN